MSPQTRRTCSRWLVSATIAVATLVGPVAAYADDATSSLDIMQFAYQPSGVEVAPGTTVVWTNRDAIIHSVTAGSPDAPGDTFDSGLFDQGQSFSFTFTDPGEYTYFCTRHNFMTGTLTVV